MAKSRKSNPPFSFDPNSLNATLATIIAKQDSHAEEMRACFADTKSELVLVKEQTTKTNGRVSAVEVWIEGSKGKIAGIAAACGAVGTVIAWLAGILLR